MRPPRNAPIDYSKRFGCQKEGCKARFNKRHELKRHEESHSSIRKWGCPMEGCELRFHQKVNMETHIRGIHEHVRHTCPMCGNVYKGASNLTHHKRRAHGEMHNDEPSHARRVSKTLQGSDKGEATAILFEVPKADAGREGKEGLPVADGIDVFGSTSINVTIGHQPDSTAGSGTSGSRTAAACTKADDESDVDDLYVDLDTSFNVEADSTTFQPSWELLLARRPLTVISSHNANATNFRQLPAGQATPPGGPYMSPPNAPPPAFPAGGYTNVALRPLLPMPYPTLRRPLTPPPPGSCLDDDTLEQMRSSNQIFTVRPYTCERSTAHWNPNLD